MQYKPILYILGTAVFALAMTTSIEMNNLSSRSNRKGKQRAEPTEDKSINVENNEAEDPIDNTIAVWAWVTASLLSLSSIPLLIFPRLLIFLATPSSEYIAEHSDLSTPLVRFLSIQLGICLLAISITLILYIPSPVPTPLVTKRRRDSLGHPLLGPLTGFSLLASLISYNTKSVSSLSSIVFTETIVIGLWGTWVLMFEGSSHISKKTGADKRTSAFLFHNKAAASSRKKEWKMEQSQQSQ